MFHRFRVCHAGCLLVVCLIGAPADAQGRDRWTPEQANAWYEQQPWLVGCNFTPSTASNQLEMWQAETFDPETIDRELKWASELGFTSIRVYLHNLVWEQDAAGFLQRMERFLEIADRYGLGVMFVLLDAVWDPHPVSGPQKPPVPGVHNSRWVQAPGADILGDPERHEELRPYIEGVIGHFRDDRRVHVWDVFNEPENTNAHSWGEHGRGTELANKVDMSTRLLPRVFHWARQADPSQPLTAAVWLGPWPDHDRVSPIEKIMLEESDVISFHNYERLDSVRERVNQLRRYGRPILCTEYMARTNGSRFDPILGYFQRERIGAWNWGFVAGKTQTHYPWDSWQKPYPQEPDVWFHEILRPDGSPYDPEEVRYIRRVTGVD